MTQTLTAYRSIESEDDLHFLLHDVLLHRYAIIIDGEATPAANVVEKAVDLHAIEIITSSGYQKCIMYLWRGWLIQNEDDPSTFVDYRDRDNTKYLVHLDPDRIRVPMFQNAAQMIISVIYVVLFTITINTPNPDGKLDTAEVLLYIFTLGFICEEFTKWWKAGYHILGFWNAFNGILYSLITVSFVVRFVGLWHPQNNEHDEETRRFYNKLSYNFLAFSAPMFWTRLLLYLDTFRFFGAMLVVLKVMMKESIIFFALLGVMIIGFLQAFVGLDVVEDLRLNDYGLIMKAMANAIMQSPDFDVFDDFSPPFGTILYYLFTFIVMVRISGLLSQEVPTNVSFRWFFSTSSSLFTTRHTKIFTRTQTTNSSPSLHRRPCSSSGLPMRTCTSHLSIWSKWLSSPCSSGGCQRIGSNGSMTSSWASATRP